MRSILRANLEVSDYNKEINYMTNTMKTKFRWAIRNKKTGTVRGSKPTREAARMTKRTLGGAWAVFDTVSGSYIR